MKLFRILFVFIALTAIVKQSSAQTILQVNKLEETYKACVAKGTDAVGCGAIFHKELVNVLDTTYTKLVKTYSGAEKKVFEDDHKVWMEERDAFYKDLDYTFKRKIEMKEWEPSMQTVILDEKSRYLKSKIFSLVRIAHKFE